MPPARLQNLTVPSGSFQRVSGRGGIGNITESDPRSTSKPLRRASLFKGGGDAIAALSSPKDRLDMNAYDEQERLDYAREKGL